MHAGLDVSLIVEEQVKDIMAFVFVSTDDTCLNRNVIGDQGISDNAFLEAEIFGRIARIERLDTLKFLTVTAGMQVVAQRQVLEDRQVRDVIADEIAGC